MIDDRGFANPHRIKCLLTPMTFKHPRRLCANTPTIVFHPNYINIEYKEGPITLRKPPVKD